MARKKSAATTEAASPPASGGHARSAYSSPGDIQALVAGLRGRDIVVRLEDVAHMTEDDRTAIVGWLGQQRGILPPACLNRYLEASLDIATPKAAAATSSKKPFQIAVEFGNVGIGEGTARLGIKIDRTSLRGGLNDADRYFAGRRLHGRVVVSPKGDLPGQSHLFDGAERHVDSVFDVKGFAVSAKSLSCGLTFSLEEIDVGELAHFAKQSGWLQVETVSALDEDDDVDGEGDSEGPRLFDVEAEEASHPDVAAGKDRPIGTPALEAAAKVAKEKAADLVATENPPASDPPPKPPKARKAKASAGNGVARARSIDVLDIPEKWMLALANAGIDTVDQLDDEIAVGWKPTGRLFNATARAAIEKARLALPPDDGKRPPPPADDVPDVPDHDAQPVAF